MLNTSQYYNWQDSVWPITSGIRSKRLMCFSLIFTLFCLFWMKRSLPALRCAVWMIFFILRYICTLCQSNITIQYSYYFFIDFLISYRFCLYLYIDNNTNRKDEYILRYRIACMYMWVSNFIYLFAGYIIYCFWSDFFVDWN